MSKPPIQGLLIVLVAGVIMVVKGYVEINFLVRKSGGDYSFFYVITGYIFSGDDLGKRIYVVPLFKYSILLNYKYANTRRVNYIFKGIS